MYHKFLPPKTPDRCGALKWPSYVLVSDRVVFPDGVRPGAVFIEGSRIVDVSEEVTVDSTAHPHVMNFKHAVISPGVIDVHIHLNEPGRVEWEAGITNGTMAAAVGGVTTVIDMPLNSDPVTTDVRQLEAKKKLAKAKAFTNIGFWAGLVPGNAANHTLLSELLAGGALGFKSFMCNSGINDFPAVEAEHIAAALPFLKSRGVPFFVHAEVVTPVEMDAVGSADPTHYTTYLATRPPKFERDAVRLLVKLLDEDSTPAAPGFSVHVAHLADGEEALEVIRDAQSRGHPLTVETCAHYLTFSAEDVPAGHTQYKCAPPLREASHRNRLISAVRSGAISLVSSDHSPAPPALKETESGNFLRAWGGISGVQYLLPATWTALWGAAAGGEGQGEGAAKEGDLLLLARVLSEGPAKLAGVAESKGRLAPGYDADLVIWEPETRANTSVSLNLHTHKLSPYTDVPLYGKVLGTIVGGELTALFGNINRRSCGKLVLSRNT
ncbi:allantoinase [Volvox carteri f. nagariensis]|uniref:allantoinase n=1 Tax=Volvox carteri f. nagariensis TaxID=3068 RepID=D8TYX7_VOLCA|nr:allantoinase [Volvox carteri f. nagariensis]EFJ47391.1 allantoinase [Volvox carteri f. nagariensis]|eukprot:XP_002951580.1 allantoinase [Volvox carteri f. nagariensis]